MVIAKPFRLSFIDIVYIAVAISVIVFDALFYFIYLVFTTWS